MKIAFMNAVPCCWSRTVVIYDGQNGMLLTWGPKNKISKKFSTQLTKSMSEWNTTKLDRKHLEDVEDKVKEILPAKERHSIASWKETGMVVVLSLGLGTKIFGFFCNVWDCIYINRKIRFMN